MKKNAGFTLMELMIVVGILSIIAAITIPNLLRSQETAKEGAALAAMRVIATSESSFLAAGVVNGGDGKAIYGTLGELGEPPGNGTPFIDSVLSSGLKGDYTFLITAADAYPATYFAGGVPAGNVTMKHFFVDESGVIRFNRGSDAASDSTPVQ